MELTSALVTERAAEYEREEPFYGVEQVNAESFPSVFRNGEFTWRDAMWVVRWYYRRFLGAELESERRAAESAFRENEYDEVADAFEAVFDAGGDAERVRRLLSLEGVDVPVASAYLQFVLPAEYVVVGEREWGALVAADRLTAPYPPSPSVDAYRRYLEACRDLAEELDVGHWTLYRGLWRLGSPPE